LDPVGNIDRIDIIRTTKGNTGRSIYYIWILDKISAYQGIILQKAKTFFWCYFTWRNNIWK